MKRKFRIKEKKFYVVDDTCEGSYKVLIRPTIQVRIFGIWFTLTEIVKGNKDYANELAESIIKQLRNN